MMGIFRAIKDVFETERNFYILMLVLELISLIVTLLSWLQWI
jgi:hypothetical protein